MSAPLLLDSNGLIALVVGDHEHHDRAAEWIGNRPVALCPIVEGALLRFLVRCGESPEDARTVLAAVHRREHVEWWADDVSYRSLDTTRLTGHRQLTDAYLVSLARAHGTHLATLDAGLVAVHGDSAVLIPKA